MRQLSPTFDSPAHSFFILLITFIILSNTKTGSIECSNGGENMKIAWVTDSSAYLPKDANHSGLYVVPLQINHENTSYKDGIDLTAEGFYDLLSRSESSPKSSQPTVYDIEHLFQALEKEYDVIIAVLISRQISGTFDTVSSIAKSLSIPVYLVDSKIVSWPLYDLIEQGRLLEKEGLTALSISQSLNQKDKMYHNRIFVADLNQLLKGGRIGKVGFLVGSLLKIHPILKFKEGTIQVAYKIRTRRRAILQMINDFELPSSDMWVLHCGDEKVANEVKQQLQHKFPTQAINIGELSPIIAIHGGQGSFAIVSKV
jgi:DegV family protein with EDD domain